MLTIDADWQLLKYEKTFVLLPLHSEKKKKNEEGLIELLHEKL